MLPFSCRRLLWKLFSVRLHASARLATVGASLRASSFRMLSISTTIRSTPSASRCRASSTWSARTRGSPRCFVTRCAAARMRARAREDARRNGSRAASAQPACMLNAVCADT
eukprot:6212624-Pleurochrysis_carterae.AAC.6